MRAIHQVYVDNEMYFCPVCGNFIDVEEYEKQGVLWTCSCGNRCDLTDDIDEVLYT